MPSQLNLDEQFYENICKSLSSQKRLEPAYEDHRWTVENLHKYTELVNSEKFEESQRKNHALGRKVFFIAETGHVWQNNYLIDAVVWYERCGFLSQDCLDKLLSYDKPVFRVDVKEETETRSCVFRDKTYSLINAAMERKDEVLLKKLKTHIG